MTLVKAISGLFTIPRDLNAGEKNGALNLLTLTNWKKNKRRKERKQGAIHGNLFTSFVILQRKIERKSVFIIISCSAVQEKFGLEIFAMIFGSKPPPGVLRETTSFN